MLANACTMYDLRAPLFTPAELTYAAPMGSKIADSALMLRYCDGDVAAFEELYARHKDSVYRYLLRLAQNREAAEDVFQEVWGKIINARSSYRRSAKFTTFLYRVAHNCFIDYVRKHKRHAMHCEYSDDLQMHPGEQPEVITERLLAKQRLNAALAELPEEQRDAFLLYEEAGLSLDQIATVTGSNREASKSRLRYATAKLRAAIEEPGEEQ
jgi:RNA polymerase sigma-70 factor (ECF subfamily)